MKISKIEPYVVSQKLNQSFYFSQWEYNSRTICIIKITADDGTYGWGEGYGPAFLVKAGIEFFAPFILGSEIMNTEIIWQKMYLRSLDYARRGIMLSSLSAIDIALWDIKGKHLNLSVSVLLGGRRREEIIPYATGLYFTNGNHLTKKLIDEALMYKEQGFKAIKMKVGLGVKEDTQNVMKVREAIGDDINLMIDSNHAFSLKEAIQLALNLEEFNIGWFEEPISPELYSDYAKLRKRTSIPIAGGECEYLRFGFLQLFKNQCVDIAQPDICACGGLTEVRKIISMAETFGVEVIPHTWGTGIALATALHLISNLNIQPGRMNEPDAMIEFDRTENKLRDILVQPAFIVNNNGKLKVPDKPGLGVDVDEDLLKEFRIK
jgi:D-galactarolactone cycloisomerase